MGYHVIWLDEAIDDLRRAVSHIAKDNPMAARRTGERIFKQVKVLVQFPRFGRVFPKLGREDVREIPVPPYRVIYHVHDPDRTVNILTVWHGARQEPEPLPGL